MMTPNTTESHTESQEAINTQKSWENVYSKLIKKFTKNELKNKKKRAGFVSNVNADGEITPEILEKIRDFAWTDTEFDGLNIEASNITYAALQREISGYAVTLNNTKEQLKTRFLQENDISADEYEKKISKTVNGLEEPELNALLVRSTQRTKLLQKIYGKKKVPRSIDTMTFLSNFNLSERYGKLSEHEQLLVRDVDKKIKNNTKLGAEDFITLFDTGVFSDNEKKQILRTMVPNISLSKAVSLGFLSQKDALKYKVSIAQQSAWVQKSDWAAIVWKMNDNEIMIPTYDFLWKTKNAQKIVDDVGYLESFVQDFNTMSDEVAESMKGIKTLEDLKSELWRHPKVNGEDNFKEGVILEMKHKRKTESWYEDVILYGKVLKASDNGTYKLLNRWRDAYTKQTSDVSTETYDDLLSLVANGNPQINLETTEVNIMTELELEWKLASWKIENGDKNPVFLDKTEASSRIEELDKERKERVEKLKKQWKKSHQIEQDDEIQRIDQEKSEYNDKLFNLDDINAKSMQTKLDEIDSVWKKYKFEDGLTFQVWKWKTKDNYYTIHTINPIEQKVYITSPAWDQEMSFIDFFENFEKLQCTRVSDAKNFQGIFDNASTDGSDTIQSSWDGFKLDGGKIVKKESTQKIEYRFLGSHKWAKWDADKLLEIHWENGWLFTISFWKLKSAKKEKEEYDYEKNKVIKKKAEWEKFTLEDKKYRVTAGWLDAYIRDNDLIPRGLEDAKEEQDLKWEQIQQNFNIWSWFWKGLNIATVAASGKVFYEWVENYFKEWRDERAARFAYAWWKHLLPGDMKWDLRSRIEDAQKKRADDYLERLKNMASFHATAMIKWWLLDPNTKQEKLEAAVEFMFSKYGTLCAKGPLYPYQWKFLWYQSLGGKIGDKLYMEEKAKAEALNEQFSEEGLVWVLIKKQCQPWWFNGRKLRSKWYKTLKKDRSTWKTWEIETGENDAKDERNIESRIWWGMWELYWWNYPTAIWWAKQVVDKWWSMDKMNKIPFVMAFSWAWYNFDSKVINDQIKKFPAEGRLLMMMRFMSHTSDVDLLNETILEICKSLEKKWYAGIQEKAQGIFNQIKTPHPDWEYQKIKMVEWFYNQYGEAITNALYMLNHWKNDKKEQSRNISKMIVFEKGENKVFQKYYDKMRAFVDSDDTTVTVESFMNDAFDKAGTSGLHENKFARELLEFSSANSFTKREMGKNMWEEFRWEIQAIIKDKTITPVQQKFLLKRILRWLISGIMYRWVRKETFQWFTETTSPLYIFGDWGMYLYDDIVEPQITPDNILDENNTRVDSILDMYVNGIILYERDGISSRKWTSMDTVWFPSKLSDITWDVEQSTINALNKKKQEKTSGSKESGQVDRILEDA